MTSLAYTTHEPVAPTETEAMLARETSLLLASHVSTRQDLRVRIMNDEKAGDICRCQRLPCGCCSIS